METDVNRGEASFTQAHVRTATEPLAADFKVTEYTGENILSEDLSMLAVAEQFVSLGRFVERMHKTRQRLQSERDEALRKANEYQDTILDQLCQIERLTGEIDSARKALASTTDELAAAREANQTLTRVDEVNNKTIQTLNDLTSSLQTDNAALTSAVATSANFVKEVESQMEALAKDRRHVIAESAELCRKIAAYAQVLKVGFEDGNYTLGYMKLKVEDILAQVQTPRTEAEALAEAMPSPAELNVPRVKPAELPSVPRFDTDNTAF